jgi:hypothetical protein
MRKIPLLSVFALLALLLSAGASAVLAQEPPFTLCIGLNEQYG